MKRKKKDIKKGSSKGMEDNRYSYLISYVSNLFSGNGLSNTTSLIIIN